MSLARRWVSSTSTIGRMSLTAVPAKIARLLADDSEHATPSTRPTVAASSTAGGRDSDRGNDRRCISTRKRHATWEEEGTWMQMREEERKKEKEREGKD
ncbi:hypothetical protein P5V15_011226 [Pogonomyrmex californicus]